MQPPPRKENLLAAMKACVENAERLEGQLYDVEFEKPQATLVMLAMIAQEECAKAFLLYLVFSGVIEWRPKMLKLLNSHVCKHLMGIIMEFAGNIRLMDALETDEDWDAFWNRPYPEEDKRHNIPQSVADSIRILRHAELKGSQAKINDFGFELEAAKIFDGERDQYKQDALYVRLGSDLQVLSTPSNCDPLLARTEWERTRAYNRLMQTLLKGTEGMGESYDRVQQAFKEIFRSDSYALDANNL